MHPGVKTCGNPHVHNLWTDWGNRRGQLGMCRGFDVDGLSWDAGIVWLVTAFARRLLWTGIGRRDTSVRLRLARQASREGNAAEAHGRWTAGARAAVEGGPGPAERRDASGSTRCGCAGTTESAQA